MPDKHRASTWIVLAAMLFSMVMEVAAGPRLNPLFVEGEEPTDTTKVVENPAPKTQTPVPVVETQTSVPVVETETPVPVVETQTSVPVVETETPVPVVEAQTVERKKLLSVKTNMLFYGAWIPGYNRWAPIPNIAIEYYPKKGHFTFGASFDMPWWRDYNAHKYFQFRNYQVETRWYLNGANKAYGANGTYKTNKPYGANEPNKPNDPNSPDRTNKAYNRNAFTGFYLQGYAHLAVFGICFDEDRGWVGEGIGAGIGAGFVTPISKNGHWKLEIGLQAGFFHCKYDPYKYENPVNPAYRDGLYYYKWTQKPSLFKKRQYRWNWIGPTRIGITLSYDLLYRRIQKKGVSFRGQEKSGGDGAYGTNGANGANKAYRAYEANRTQKTHRAQLSNEPKKAERRVTP